MLEFFRQWAVNSEQLTVNKEKSWLVFSNWTNNYSLCTIHYALSTIHYALSTIHW